jgi:tRNA A-37 threonylcarbamoyl transferase component Bud32
MELVTPTVLLDKYRVEHSIGQGGMGNVYAATHLTMGRQVAIKLLRAELSRDADLVQRFQREVVATARISNPYVVSVYDVDRLPDGTLFIVMDLLRGETLRERMERGSCAREECVDILVETAAALTAAHQAGVVHRDLKPENILLASDPLEQVKVVDFGIAKLEDSQSITITNAVLGTPAYMAPEQLVSLRNTSVRSDLWSLGVVAFELLAGRPPFHADSIPGLCAAILTGEPLTANELPEMDAGLRAAVLKCLERDPEQRFEGAAAFARAIASHGTQRSQRALALIEASESFVRAAFDAREPGIEPTEAAAKTPLALGHASTQVAGVQARASVRPNLTQRSHARRWAGVGAASVLALGVCAWGLREQAVQHTAIGAAAASWIAHYTDKQEHDQAQAARVHEPSARFRVEGPEQAISMLGFSVDGRLLTTFSAESGRVRVWSHEPPDELRKLPAEGVERIYLGANGYALTKNAKGTLTQWSLLSGVSTGSEELQGAIAFAGSVDLGVVVVTAERQLITMSDLGRSHDVIKLPLDPSGVLAVRSDRRRAVIGSGSASFLYVDIAREQVTKLESPSKSALSAAMFLAQPHGVITGDHAGRVMIWSPPSQAAIELPRLSGPVSAISASSDGEQVLVASPRQLLLYEPATGRSRMFSPAGVAMSTARLSFDGSQVAVGNEQGEVLLFATDVFE